MGSVRLELGWFAVAAAIPLLIGLRAYRSRADCGKLFAYLLFSQSAWALGQGLELLASTTSGKLLWDSAQYVPMSLVAILTVLFSLRFAKIPEPRWLRLSLFSYFGPPVFLIATAPLHHALRQDAHVIPGVPFDALHYSYNLFDYWIAIGYLSSAPVCLLLLSRRLIRVHENLVPGHLAVMLGLLLPTIAGLVSTAMNFRILGQRDLSFVIFGLGAVLIAWGIEKGGALSLGSVARDLIFDKMPDGAVITDQHRRISDHNQSSLLWLKGGPPYCGDVLNDLDVDARGRDLLLATPASVAQIVKAQGGSAYLEIVWYPLEDGAGRLYLLRDVTEQEKQRQHIEQDRDSLRQSVRHQSRKLEVSSEKLKTEEQRRIAMEERLRQAEKMDALGRLAGGVAHDFNNLLTVIMGNVDVARDFAPDEELKAHLKEIEEASKSAATLASQLLSFSRKDVVATKTIDTQAALRNVYSMLRRLIREDIELALDIAPLTQGVRFDEGQLQQVLINLVVNARDAMPHGGKIAISTENVSGFSPRLSGTERNWVRIDVRDNGLGMSKEQLSHIFEPFFTTKSIGKGTGLGLAMVYGAVQQHGGYCEVESEVGIGSCFSLYLERAALDAEKESGAETSSYVPPRPDGRVIVVEDESAVRKMLARALSKAGFEVVTFESGDAVLQEIDALETPDLLISDVVMPGILGHQLASQLVQRFPGLQVILMSGYSEEREALLSLPFAHRRLSKPFTPKELLEAVDDAVRPSQNEDQSTLDSVDSLRNRVRTTGQ